MDYNFPEVEKKWRQKWADDKTYKVDINESKEKYYVLDMFPYPSGAGLHVGHPLGYIASDIYSRFKRLKGFNVLHPMGFDAFGLPAEQYAIQTGQHPAVTTDTNLKRYREQLDKIGFCFDWSREFRTTDPSYYKWTQWIFAQLFDAWYNKSSNKAERIDTLVAAFEANGNSAIKAVHDCEIDFSADEWKGFSEKEQSDILLSYRMAFLSETMVNWCPELGTVLANDEIKDGVSERGGHPVERKLMQQWSLRITAYADRLLKGLDNLDWSESIKETQRNWIGKSKGASVNFPVENSDKEIEVFTTRPDTIFGVGFMVIAPEHEWVDELTTAEQKEEVDAYVIKSKNRSERERMADVKTVTGVFTGSYVVHPFSGEKIQIWLGDYVLAGYGTGAVMAVPAHDSRDYAFAKEFGLPIKEVIAGGNIEEEAYEAKSGKVINSDFLDGLKVKDAINKSIGAIMDKGIGRAETNFRLRDAVFSRQRYWGEPFPVAYKNEIPFIIDTSNGPLELPEVDKYLPTADGQPPLARAEKWEDSEGNRYEYNTMPGWAGSSWYFLRYMDPHNENAFVSEEAVKYWGQVDLYIGGSEHATGHLLYSRFWTKFLHDLGYLPFDEPFKKLINQGMILGTSAFAYRVKNTNQFVSHGLKEDYDTARVHVDVNFVNGNEMDTEAFKNWRADFKDVEFILEDGKYICGNEVEKMSKSKFNVVNPDLIVEKFGADTLRLYEMFLGPLEQSKPWSTKGIEGVSKFIRKFWNLCHDSEGKWNVSEEKATKEELKVLHKTIKKVGEDVENFSFNTSVSAFMVCVNELQELKCNKKEIIENVAILLHPYAPYITEELWQKFGNSESILNASFPEFDPSVLVESEFNYPVSFNGKRRFDLALPADMAKEEIEKTVLGHEMSQKWLEGKAPKKVIIVPKRIVNVVI